MKFKYILRLSAAGLLCLLLMSSCSNYVADIEYGTYSPVSVTADEDNKTTFSIDYDKYDLLDLESLYSKSAAVYYVNSKTLIGIKNAFDAVAPASLTKIMTAIVAIENIKSLDSKVTISEDIFEYIEEQNASVAGFCKNEELTVRDLLYGTMLPSGADAAITLADFVAGSETAFAEMMNEKAKELGCYNTHFVNVTGLDAENHYSTAYDMCLILSYAYENPTFREIFSSSSYTVSSTNMHPYGMTMKSTVFEFMKNNGADITYLVGGKTGYTYDAGLCLATISKKGNNVYCVVTLGGGDGEQRPAYHVFDYKTISATCFE